MLPKRFRKIALSTGLLLCLLVFIASNSPHVNSKLIIDKMSASIEEIQALKFKLKKKERVEGELRIGEQDVKFNRNPKKIYTRIISPNEGAEVLYIEGQNNKKAYVNPNAFPYVTLSLDPYGSAMRNKNHHTVHEVGFDYINSIVSHIAKKSSADFDKLFLYQGDTLFNGKDCYKLLIDYTPYSYVNYTVKEGETLKDIGYKLFVSDYMILQLNEDEVDDYDDVEAGQVIKVPNAYARKTFLYIDKKTNLPLIQKMYDEKGLIAQYEFHNLQLNPAISPAEFTKSYKDYNF